jgi:hypothetical protein
MSDESKDERNEGPPGFWVERWREKLPEKSFWRRRYDRLFLPVSDPVEFTEDHEELVAKLRPPAGLSADERSREILAEAQAALASAEARGEGAERRATTLQGAVAIAASVLLAGAALLGDPTKVHGPGWRIGFALLLFAVTVCLVAAGARALGATARIHIYHRPTPSDVLRRAQLDPVEARIELAAETFKDSGYDEQIASWKISYLAAAAWWFRGALFALLALSAFVAVYIAFSGHSEHPKYQSRQPEALPAWRSYVR